jgi:hypothetical protein
MTATQTNPYPNIAPPAGASWVGDWQPEGYRIVFGPTRTVAGEVKVYTSAAQISDGTVDQGGKVEPPMLHVDNIGAVGLTTVQACALLGVIADALAELAE